MDIPFTAVKLVLLGTQCELDENRLRQFPIEEQAAIRVALDEYLDSLGSSNRHRDNVLAERLAEMRDRLRTVVAVAREAKH
jgi:hypothetical protein